MADWSISELVCGNGWLGISPIPGRHGRYEENLSQILLWKPSLVLTMTTSSELERVGASSLGSDLTHVGVEWRHLPIIDFGAPASDIAERWSETSNRAHEMLANGGKVLAHCFGGCGRSGMAVMRLMVEAGENADPAIERLRDVRPCAVETEE
ncbi:MAG: protein phosphatase [Boseongicola sp.]|nr:protein phosphatase [Boseongicola sp.]